jgi:hypothetical protein
VALPQAHGLQSGHLEFLKDGRQTVKLILWNFTESKGQTINPDGFNPFLQPHYLLLNLALGRNGGTRRTSQRFTKEELTVIILVLSKSLIY